jgi:acyl-CoA synthetase (NDP forming)
MAEDYGSTESSRVPVLEIVQKARQESRVNLLESEAKSIARSFGIPVPDFEVAPTSKKAVQSARRIGYPVVLKVVSTSILHKSEAGGVKLNLLDDDEVQKAYDEIIVNVTKYDRHAEIIGVLVQKMVPSGIETIVGGIRDATFGPVVLFGSGGILVEVIRDVTFRIAPLSELDASEMLDEIKGRALLDGVRGQSPADKEMIRKIILATSRMICEIEDLDQIDLNPVIVYDHGASVVDVRMILTKDAARTKTNRLCG